MQKMVYFAGLVAINCRFGPLPLPELPLFGGHLEQRIYNEDNNKKVTGK